MSYGEKHENRSSLCLSQTSNFIFSLPSFFSINIWHIRFVFAVLLLEQIMIFLLFSGRFGLIKFVTWISIPAIWKKSYKYIGIDNRNSEKKNLYQPGSLIKICHHHHLHHQLLWFLTEIFFLFENFFLFFFVFWMFVRSFVKWMTHPKTKKYRVIIENTSIFTESVRLECTKKKKP